MNRDILINKELKKLIVDYPFVKSYFEESGLIKLYDENKSIVDISNDVMRVMAERNLTADKFINNFVIYFENVMELLGLNEADIISSITIVAGYNKSGVKENFDKLEINRGEVVSIVGPTGSGKSRLLADIEWTADRDTPTKRQILVNGKVSDKKNRFSTSNKLVAQLSQNMNFVMDLTVAEFLEVHATSRMVESKKELIDKIFVKANQLSGEKFTIDQSITSLSGGQSRALMIADTAILSKSPIILIDEIENAGINRKNALDLLLSEDKIVLMATHDPVLALMADKRIIISNGGISDIIVTTEHERQILDELNRLDEKINSYREKLRYGELLN